MSAGFWWAMAVGAFTNCITDCVGAHFMGNQLILPVVLLGIVTQTLVMLGAAAIYEYTNQPVAVGGPDDLALRDLWETGRWRAGRRSPGDVRDDV